MDRDSIEHPDFPVGRRGYDRAAVDAHLRHVADELDARTARPAATPPPPLSAGTSEQVRVILEAAEAGAAELRADAGRRAGEHVAGVEQVAGGMLSRLDELERELGSLLEALRKSGERLSDGLARLQEQVGDVPGADSPADEPPPAGQPAPKAHEPPAAGQPEHEPPPAGQPAHEPPPAGQPEHEPPPAGQPEHEPPPAGHAAPAEPSRNGDEAGARLIALNMALSGTPREETARYLAENFALADPDALLDDVYDRAGE